MGGLYQTFVKIRQHNREMRALNALLGLASDLGGLGIIWNPKQSATIFARHIKQDRKHLSRWTNPDNPENPGVVFADVFDKMEKLRLLNEFDGHQFTIDVMTTVGPVWVVGNIRDGGELDPRGVYTYGVALDKTLGPVKDLTAMIEDPKERW